MLIYQLKSEHHFGGSVDVRARALGDNEPTLFQP